MSTYTVKSQPPAKENAQRRSKWAELFDECREHPGEWRKVLEPMSKSTASQIASDIRNAYRRDPEKSRLRGLERGEKWDAVWGEDKASKTPGKFYVWLRFVSKESTSGRGKRR